VSGINVGLFCSTPAVALSRNIHKKHAMEMLLTGNLITANEALAYGLVNKVVPLSGLHSGTTNLATSIACKSNYAIRLGKKMFYEQLQHSDLETAYEFATDRIVCNMKNDDTKRGIDEFLYQSASKNKG
jgi:enoyl-CoA hydratase/carnithine racemase